MELGLGDPRRQRGARQVPDFLEPMAEAVEGEEELEVAVVAAGVEPPGDARDPLDVFGARDAVEVLVERAQIGGEAFVHVQWRTGTLACPPTGL